MLVRVSQMWSRNESPRRDFSLRDRRSPLPTTAHVADSQRSSRTRRSKNSVCEDSQRRRSRLRGNVATRGSCLSQGVAPKRDAHQAIGAQFRVVDWRWVTGMALGGGASSPPAEEGPLSAGGLFI